MIVRRTILAAIALIGSVGFATAQDAQNGAAAPEGSASSPHQPKGTVTHGGKSQAAAQAATLPGWNIVHATNCDAFFDGITDTLFVFPQEGGQWSTTDPAFQNLIAPQCSQGNWVAFFVFDSFGDWNAIYTFDYK